MIKSIILVGQRYSYNYVAQSNYWIIQTKLLTVLLLKKKVWNEKLKKVRWNRKIISMVKTLKENL